MNDDDIKLTKSSLFSSSIHSFFVQKNEALIHSITRQSTPVGQVELAITHLNKTGQLLEIQNTL